MTSNTDETERSIKEQSKETVKKAFAKPEPGVEPDPERFQPLPGTEGVGESITRRGEDVSKTEQEAGRYSTDKEDTPAGRPTGESTRRDMGGLNPDEK
jgi:hypothetical protein